MILRLLACLIVLAFAGLTILDRVPAQLQPNKTDERTKVTVCQLKENPAAYNHKLVEVTGFISHAFEDFTIFDPACPSWPDVWLEYGGTTASDTMYCCGVVPSHKRPTPLVIENIKVDLIADRQLEAFKTILTPDTVVHATLVGRYFAGEKNSGRRGDRYGGYGHMGCCTLFAIQQVTAVDPHTSHELDYHATAYPRGLDKYNCYGELTDIDPSAELIKAQARADSGDEEWAFSDPMRVATHGLAKLLKIDEKSIKLRPAGQAQGQFGYEWRAKKNGNVYMVVVTRPYILTFFAKDPKRVAWVLRTAYSAGCNEDEKPVRRIN
jgi:hypothetical protein